MKEEIQGVDPVVQLLDQLNEEQRRAVTTLQGPVLVLAGAGTGKTRVITYRIVHALDGGIPPEQIVAVTFTNKAAREMRDRVAALLGEQPRDLVVSTFHALGMRVLRAEASRLGYRPNFTIYDVADQTSLVRTILHEIRGSSKASRASAILATISRAKSAFELPQDLFDKAEGPEDTLVAQIYERYQEQLKALNCVDFDDLILLPGRLLESDEEVRTRYQNRWRYILVDEYQDTNGSQYRLLRQLIGPERNICVVGDDDQSIYGFRGAESEKILRFEQDFPGTQVVKLEENYRSTPAILNLANEVIALNARRHDKRLRSTLPQGLPVRLVVADDELSEVNYTVSEIQNLVDQRGVSLDSVAVLMRSAAQGRPFEEKLRLRGLPYTLVGGQSYFDRKEVRDVAAFWRVAVNPADDISLLRIINVPARGFGPKTITRLGLLARAKEVSLFDALKLVGEGSGEFPDGVRRSARAFSLILTSAQERFAGGDHAATARELLEAVEYKKLVADLYTDPVTRKARWNAVEELLRAVSRWSDEVENAGKSFARFLNAFALDKPGEREEKNSSTGKLRLMTLHAAKGLEFLHVFLVGVEDDFLPHRKAVEEGEHAIEEERRLLYVGITRARKALVLTLARSRERYGKTYLAEVSRFLTEIENSQLYEEEVYDRNAVASPTEVENILASFRKRRDGPPHATVGRDD